MQLLVSELGKRGSGSRMLKCIDEVQRSLSGGIGGRSFRHGAIVRKKFNGFGDAFGGGFGDVYAVAPIVFWGSSNIPAVDTMRIPGAPVGGCFVYQDFCAGRGYRGSIVIEGTVKVCLRGKSWIDACRAKQIERRGCLLD